ncbi:MAG TPA: DUF4131 domain-containing protein, partial [Dokdonella sp.]|nr:DUF4131 domain-containing protein [Dokdonella sp.]
MLETRIPIVGAGAAVAMLCGALAVHALPALPPRGIDVALAVVGVLALPWPRLRAAGWLAFGIGWCALHAAVALDARLPVGLEGRDVLVTGTIEGLPQRRDDATRFVLGVEDARLDGVELPLRGRA